MYGIRSCENNLVRVIVTFAQINFINTTHSALKSSKATWVIWLSFLTFNFLGTVHLSATSMRKHLGPLFQFWSHLWESWTVHLWLPFFFFSINFWCSSFTRFQFWWCLHRPRMGFRLICQERLLIIHIKIGRTWMNRMHRYGSISIQSISYGIVLVDREETVAVHLAI